MDPGCLQAEDVEQGQDGLVPSVGQSLVLMVNKHYQSVLKSEHDGGKLSV